MTARPTATQAEDAVRTLLEYIGEDPDRPGLLATPGRYVRALAEMTSGYTRDPARHMQVDFDLENGTPYDQVIISDRIPFASLCEHHLMPFVGHATVGYIPGPTGRVVGLSKLARVVTEYATRLQVQERLTQQVAEAVMSIGAGGVGVILSARHTCQCLRGVRKDGTMVTSAMLGWLRESATARAELLALVGTHGR
jgi:GTP cyclohydrolase IA